MNWDTKEVWEIPSPLKYVTEVPKIDFVWNCRLTTVDLNSSSYCGYESQSTFFLSLNSVTSVSEPAFNPLSGFNQLKNSYYVGDCSECWLYRPVARWQRPHLIFTTASLLGVTRGQGQVPRVRLESRLKCSEKPHTAARNEKNNNVDMAFPLWQ